MKTPYKLNAAQAILLGGCLLASAQAMAGPMTFSQIPPGAGARDPAPNIIVTVDDSGSMGWDVNGCRTPDYASATYGAMDDPARATLVPAPPACPSPNTTPSRLANLKSAVRATFGNPATGDKGILPDGRVRLAWQALDDRNASSRPAGLQGNQDQLVAGQPNTLRPFTGAHRNNFDSFISSLTASSLEGTALHKMMANVNNYMSSPLGLDGPFAANPGTTRLPELSCRRSYHILMTDGAWNSEAFASKNIGNFDDTTVAKNFPDGTTYSATSQTRLYSDAWGGAVGTIADWAMANWATDFQTGLNNDVRPLFPVDQNETVGATVLAKYWNPKNNPMTWQGVTQYTIGFGRPATTWQDGPAWDNVNDDNYGDGYATKVNDTTEWLNLFDPALTRTQLEGQRRASDLWHAALNGRGKYFPARTADELKDAFEDILKDILPQTEKAIISIASNSTRLARNGFAYVASFDSKRWSGDIKAFRIDDDSGLPSTTESWKVSTLLDSTDTGVFSHSNRVVLTHNGSNGTGFWWGSLSTTQKNLLTNNGVDSDAVRDARINYLRGDRDLEQPKTGGYLRQRDSRLGDIVNSNLWYVGKPVRLDTDYPGHATFRSSYASRTPVLYVGANDGMLHGFNANTGKEVLAYVPRGVYANLRNYTLPDYTHKYFVDGNPFAGDADLDDSASGTNWRTILVSPLGAGGKGYFVLDVTNPAGFTDPGTGASSVVLMDKTEGVDSDVGHIFATPTLDNQTGSLSQQIVKLNNGRWAAIMGNGYNSSNERPVLLIQYLDGTRGLKKIIADSTNTQTNGLGAPATFDVNGNGTVDVVYAGDLKGNMWKFNLVSTNDSNWGVSIWSGSGSTCDNATTCVPFFVAKTSGGATRPITAAPTLMIHPQGGLQVIFGTGKDLEASDRGATTPPTETIFSVWDLSTYKIESARLVAEETGAITASNGRSRLVEQTVTGSGASGVIETSTNAIEYSRTDSSAKRGWFFDLPVSDERLLIAPRVFDANTLLFGTIAPKKAIEGETCDLSSAQDKGFLTFLNAISGAPPKNSVFGDEMDPTGNASRLAYGSGEFITLVGPGSTTFIPPTFACDSNDCDQAPDNTCIGPTCASCTGPDCAETTCVGADCRCTGKLCRCVGPDCDCDGACGGGGSGGFKCGLVADLLDACRSGRFGARTDWRELR